MKDVSIEYAHIYTNQQISAEHELSVNVLGDVKKQLVQDGRTSVLCIMVDDYSFPDPSFDYKALIGWLDQTGYRPDVLIRESQLIPVCDIVLQHVTNSSMKHELTEYVKAKKYPCSLFIASWYLVRLGYLESAVFDSGLSASHLINILPESFKPFEDKGLNIIRNTDFAKAADQIEYRFLQGRLL